MAHVAVIAAEENLHALGEAVQLGQSEGRFAEARRPAADEVVGFYNKMDIITRQACGFRNFETYRQRVQVLSA